MRIVRASALMLSATVSILSIQQAIAAAPMHPPVAHLATVTADHFDTKITNSYRWMESQPKPQFPAYLPRTTTRAACWRAFRGEMR